MFVVCVLDPLGTSGHCGASVVLKDWPGYGLCCADFGGVRAIGF